MSADLNGKAVGRSRGGLSRASEDFTKDKCLFFFLRSLRLFNSVNARPQLTAASASYSTYSCKYDRKASVCVANCAPLRPMA